VGAIVGALIARPHSTRPSPHNLAELLANFRSVGLPPAVIVCMLCWVGLSIYWSYAARDRSDARSSESIVSRQFHLALITAGQLLLFVPVRGLRARFLPASPALGILGFGLCVAGLALAVVARRALGSNWSGEVTAKVDHRLVTTGPYAVVRHPIYSSVFCLYVGTAIASGELHALVGVALAALAYARKIPMEEAVLAREFGEEWTRYRARTKALIPYVL
jgi:protein-S-isoprenylcysteine O-methyltransferase Ste14